MPVANQSVQYPKDLTPPLPEATVTLVAGVNEQGGVDSVVIVHPASPELNDAATQAISKWRFIPARQDGKPVRSQTDIDVVYTNNPHPYVVCNGVHRVGVGGVSPPRAIKAPDPEYTKAARKAKIAGTVVLWLIVNEKGLPEQIRIQKSLDPGLDQKAADAVKRWKFDPARKDGQPVAVMINVEVNFRLY
jgi:TonB family protein